MFRETDMKKKRVFSFSVLILAPMIFSLALIGCESEATDESGVVPQGVGPDVFTSDPVDSGITKEVTVRFTNGTSFNLYQTRIYDYGKSEDGIVYDDNTVMKPNETREVQVTLTSYYSDGSTYGILVVGYHAGSNLETGNGIIRAFDYVNGDYIKLVLERELP
jgi:hypothetical protein